jgi:hypothetical protein
MESQTTLTVFVGIVALGFLTQCIILFYMVRALRMLVKHVEDFSQSMYKTVDGLSAKLEDLLAAAKISGDKLRALQENLTATSEVIHRRVAAMDKFLSETTDTARLQILRIQDTVDLACHRTQRAVDTLYRGVIAPVSEAGAILNGLRVGLAVLLRRMRVPASRAHHQDEEMFI